MYDTGRRYFAYPDGSEFSWDRGDAVLAPNDESKSSPRAAGEVDLQSVEWAAEEKIRADNVDVGRVRCRASANPRTVKCEFTVTQAGFGVNLADRRVVQYGMTADWDATNAPNVTFGKIDVYPLAD